MAKGKATVTMDADKKCKSCIRYRASGKEAEEVGSSFYLQNAAFEKLGNPKKITMTVESAD